MRKVTPDELLDLAAYESARPRLRDAVIAHKRRRRVLLGPEMSLLFEDHDTVLHQIHEMLRAERIQDPDAVRAEVDTYNDLIAPRAALLATLMIEVEHPAVREARRRELLGLDDALHLELGGARIPAAFDAEGRFDDRIAVVRFVTFALPPDGRARLLDLASPARLVCTHPRYGYTADLAEETRHALAEDLAPDA
jgi:hypothetical protein